VTVERRADQAGQFLLRQQELRGGGVAVRLVVLPGGLGPLTAGMKYNKQGKGKEQKAKRRKLKKIIE